MVFSPSSSFDLSPVRLSYVAALRGVAPRDPLASFSYAQVALSDLEAFLCLAASNPEGRFFGIVKDSRTALDASALADRRRVPNAFFSESQAFLPEKLDYLVAETPASFLQEEQRDALFSLAEKKLAPGGLFSYRFKAYATAEEILSFLVAEFAPELSDGQKVEFLEETQTLGTAFFEKAPDAAKALAAAIQEKKPERFFDVVRATSPRSGAFEAMAGLLPRGFAFVGDADIGANYLEMAAPSQTHALLEKCKDHLLYEPIKDFVLRRLVRNDVWAKLPAEQTAGGPALFGRFTFGLALPQEQIPARIEVGKKEIDLSAPPFSNLISLMALLPLGIGDFLQHSSGKSSAPEAALNAIQLLVAAGVAQPMRAHFKGRVSARATAPGWTTGFNAYFKEAAMEKPVVRLASPIVGGSVDLSVREALVLQALCRVGLTNISGSLQPTLKEMVASNPALAAQVTDSTQLTDEVIHNLVTNVLEKNMVRWYAYGLLAA